MTQTSMGLGICAIAYNGYGRYIQRFLINCNRMEPKPNQVTIVLGKNHGCSDINELPFLFDNLVIIYDDGEPLMGRLRNLAVANTKTEWIMYMSVDDLIEKDAITTFSKYLDYDYICARWTRIDVFGNTTEHSSKTPKMGFLLRMAGHKMGFLIGHSPFRRRLWELNKYEEHDYPNSPFALGCIRNNARFVLADKPTTIYIKHVDSHSMSILPRPEEKRQAVHYKRQYERGLFNYYRDLLMTDKAEFQRRN